MATILKFKPVTADERAKAAASNPTALAPVQQSAQLLLFTGVRYERQVDVARPTRVVAKRQARQRDRLMLPD
jgi:hypothetical protein